MKKCTHGEAPYVLNPSYVDEGESRLAGMKQSEAGRE